LRNAIFHRWEVHSGIISDMKFFVFIHWQNIKFAKNSEMVNANQMKETILINGINRLNQIHWKNDDICHQFLLEFHSNFQEQSD
jgi:hypothetical protein